MGEMGQKNRKRGHTTMKNVFNFLREGGEGKKGGGGKEREKERNYRGRERWNS